MTIQYFEGFGNLTYPIESGKTYAVLDGSCSDSLYPFLRSKFSWEGHLDIQGNLVITDPELPTAAGDINGGLLINAGDFYEVPNELTSMGLTISSGDRAAFEVYPAQTPAAPWGLNAYTDAGAVVLTNVQLRALSESKEGEVVSFNLPPGAVGYNVYNSSGQLIAMGLTSEEQQQAQDIKQLATGTSSAFDALKGLF